MTKALSHKRVRILYIGGLSPERSATTREVAAALDSFVDLQLLTQADVRVVANTTVEPLSWSAVQTVITDIIEHYREYDGFVVLHDINFVLYSANLITFAFPQIGKPIIFTGASYGHDQALNSLNNYERWQVNDVSLQSNLLTALQIAILEIAGVYVAYDGNIVPAVQAVPVYSPHQTYMINGQEPSFRPQLSAFVGQSGYDPESPLQHYHDRFEHNVSLIRLQPQAGITIQPQPTSKACIITGNVDQITTLGIDLTPIPLVIYHSRWGSSQQEGNHLIIGRITWPALVAKTMHSLTETTDPKDVFKKLTTDQLGEFID